MKPYYQDAFVTLYHGDCREVDLPAVDLVLTDPPYGVTYISNAAAGKGTQPITNDGARLSLRLYRQVLPLLRARHVLWFTRWDAWPDVWGELGQWFPLRGLLVWDKGHPGMGDLRHWGSSYELIASAGAGEIVGSRDSSILRFPGVPAGGRSHPTEKPRALLSYLIEKLAAKSVLAPFAGTGSTLAAAKALCCKATGIEVEERFCEIAAERLRSVPPPRRVTAEEIAASEAAYDRLLERLAEEERQAEAAWPHKPCPQYCHVCPALLESLPAGAERWEAVLPWCWGSVDAGPKWRERCTCERPECRRRHDKAMARAAECEGAGRKGEAWRWRYAARACLLGEPLPRRV